MALTTCRECGGQVSTDAKTCPYCGTSAPAKKKIQGMGRWLLIFLAIGLVAAVLPKRDKATTATAQPPTQVAPVEKKPEKVLPPECKVAKKDGTLDPRECDLEELCKDWVFYRRKAVEYSADGNAEKSREYQTGFNKTNIWLSAYREEDVQACLKRNGG